MSRVESSGKPVRLPRTPQPALQPAPRIDLHYPASWRRIPVMRPQLPAAKRLLPYLQRIDASRTYSNHGPLVGEFHARMAGSLGLPRDAVASANSGTSALVGAILASAGRARPERPLALIPAYTFVATAAAVEQCGYQPILADIDVDSWMLDPECAAEHPRLGEIGLVVPVAPYGKPVPQAPWEAFREQTGIPVVIDAAASFDCLQAAPDTGIGEVPIALSFHATKSFGIGEGGAVACTNLDLVQRTVQALNFGFMGSRDSGCASINGKLSEYHAAVGLAEFDGWTDKRAAFVHVAALYRRQFDLVGLGDMLVSMPETSACYVLLECSNRVEAGRIATVLLDCGVESRYWYGDGIHRHRNYRDVLRGPLTATAQVASRVLGLPCAVDLEEADIARVAMAVKMAVTEREPTWWG